MRWRMSAPAACCSELVMLRLPVYASLSGALGRQGRDDLPRPGRVHALARGLDDLEEVEVEADRAEQAADLGLVDEHVAGVDVGEELELLHDLFLGDGEAGGG